MMLECIFVCVCVCMCVYVCVCVYACVCVPQVIGISEKDNNELNASV